MVHYLIASPYGNILQHIQNSFIEKICFNTLIYKYIVAKISVEMLRHLITKKAKKRNVSLIWFFS